VEGQRGAFVLVGYGVSRSSGGALAPSRKI